MASPTSSAQLAVHISLDFIFRLKIVIFDLGHNQQTIEQEKVPLLPLQAPFEF